MGKAEDCPFGEVIETLRHQSEDQYDKIHAVERMAENTYVRIFGGNGDDSGAVATRQKVTEDDVTEIKAWILEDRTERATRQQMIDEREEQRGKDQEEADRAAENRDKHRDRRQNLILGVLALIVTVALARFEMRERTADNAGRVPGSDNRTEQVDSRV